MLLLTIDQLTNLFKIYHRIKGKGSSTFDRDGIFKIEIDIADNFSIWRLSFYFNIKINREEIKCIPYSITNSIQ